MYIYIYVYMYIQYIYVYVYIYMQIDIKYIYIYIYIYILEQQKTNNNFITCFKNLENKLTCAFIQLDNFIRKQQKNIRYCNPFCIKSI